MSNSSALNMASPEPLVPLHDNIPNAIPDNHFALPKSIIPHPHQSQLAVPGASSLNNIGSLSRIFQELNMNSSSQNGDGQHHTLGDTPPHSVTSTAPGSPRM